MLTAPSGFNPVPSVSLGDTERVLEVYAESVEISRDYSPASTINMDEIISKFILDAGSVRTTTTNSNIAVIETPKEEPKKIVETPPKINISRIDDRINQKAQDDLVKLRAELEAEKEKAARIAAEQAKAVEEAKRLAEKQAEENRKAAEEAERLRIEAEKARVAQEMEKQRLAAEIERQRLETERLKAQQEAEQLRQQLAKEKAAAEQARLEAQRELEKARAAKAQAEAEEAARIAKAQAEEAERKAAEAREKAREAERAREEAEIKAKREKLEQLRKMKEEKDKQAKAQQAKQKAAAKTTKATVSRIVNNDVDNSKIDYYNSLDIQSLFAEVKKFAQQRGLSRQIIDRKLLEDNFGKANINRLILKSYLISINKGVTFGYG